MPEQYLTLLGQIPVVAAFMIFAVMLLKFFQKQQETMQQQVIEHEDRMQQATHDFIAAQNARFLEVLEIERDRRKEAMQQGLKEVQTLANTVEKLATAITQQTEAIARHDAAAIERYRHITAAIERK